MWEALAIARKFVSKAELIKVAQAVLKAQDYHEESWIHEKEKPSGGHYELTNVLAAKKAVEELSLDIFWIAIIGQWNDHYWNDIQSWAEGYVQEAA